MFALIKDQKVIEAETLKEAIWYTGLFDFDVDNGRLFFNGDLDTISYSKNYTNSEMIVEMNKRAKTLLRRSGWRIYESI
jgi:hypothetical protein